MEDTHPLAQISSTVADRAVALRDSITAIRLSEDRHLTGTFWRPDLIVASELALPRRGEFDLVLRSGSTLKARVAGRDPGTNIALLHVEKPISSPSFASGEARAGALAFAFGADGWGGVSVRIGVVNAAGPEWVSLAGGRIDSRIVLDMRLSRAEEGGPVLDAAGALLGVSTLGPGEQVLVIPAATVERIVPALLKDGRIARGWLGVALQPVAVPDALSNVAGATSGLMVMSLAEEGPAAKAGVVAGDIVLSVNGAPTRRLRRVAAQLGPDSIGATADLRVIRGGNVLSLQATIEARPA